MTATRATAAAHTPEGERPFVVCPTCEGHGQVGNSGTYTRDELDEQFGPDLDEFLRDVRAGLYDVTCPECRGRRVVRAECACAECEADRREAADYAAERAAELRAGC